MSDFTWDKDTRTFTSGLYNLDINFHGVDNCVISVIANCFITVGWSSTIQAGRTCKIVTGGGCTIDTGPGCSIETGDRCTIRTDEECVIEPGEKCVVVRRDTDEMIETEADVKIKLNEFGEKGFSVVSDDDDSDVDRIEAVIEYIEDHLEEFDRKHANDDADERRYWAEECYRNLSGAEMYEIVEKVIGEANASTASLEIIKHGYGESQFDITKDYNYRSLNFRVEVKKEDLKACLEAIGQYNRFDGAKVYEVLKELGLDEVREILVGREGSPVIYLKGVTPAEQTWCFNQVKQMLDVDEVSLKDGDIVRLWWD